MKHIFTIHSHLTFLVAYSTIKHLNLPVEDVVLLSSKYKVSFGGYPVAEAYQTRYATLWQKISTWNSPVSHDKYISKITGGDYFTAYVDLMSYYQKILITHPKCSAFHFMEEGNGAYQEYDDLQDITWPDRQLGYRTKNYFDGAFIKTLSRVLRGYNLRLLSIPYNYMAFANIENLKYFCFSSNAFYNAPVSKKIIVAPDPLDEEIQKMALGISLKNEVLWIDGSNGRYTGLPEQEYFDAIEKAILLLKEKEMLVDLIYVKLRPREKQNNNYLINALKRSGLKVEVLPDYTVLEALFAVSENCIVIGTLSAALEYAYCFGHKAYSIYPLFKSRPATFFDRMKGFWNNLETI